MYLDTDRNDCAPSLKIIASIIFLFPPFFFFLSIESMRVKFRNKNTIIRYLTLRDRRDFDFEENDSDVDTPKRNKN